MSATNPTDWAQDKKRKITKYASNPHLETFRKARDVSMPGVPLAALVGVAANGNLDENTTCWIVGDEDERQEAIRKGRKPLGGRPDEGYGKIGSENLHELGPFGVEGGHCPEPVAANPECPWVSLADSDDAQKILGRHAVHGRAWYGAHEDQIVLGIINLKRHARAVRKRLVPRLQWEEDGEDGPKAWTLWPFLCACMSWSAGSGGAAKHINAYADELVRLPPQLRPGKFFLRAGEVDDPGFKHRADEWTALRTRQKHAAGLLAIETTQELSAAEWMDLGLGILLPEVDRALVRTST